MQEWTAEQEQFIVDLADKIQNEEQWRTLIAYGLPTLLKDQSFLIELICREAERRLKDKPKGRVFADEVRHIFNELKLQLVASK